MSDPRRLHLGSGKDIKPGFVNLDIVPLPGVDVVHDLETFPWPFDDESFDEIHAFHVLEHLPDTVRVMEEIWRILTVGGLLYAEVPHARSDSFASDPTHVARFTPRTFSYFIEESPEWPESKFNFYTKVRFEILSLERINVRYPRFLNSKKLFRWFIDRRLELDPGAVKAVLRKTAPEAD